MLNHAFGIPNPEMQMEGFMICLTLPLVSLTLTLKLTRCSDVYITQQQQQLRPLAVAAAPGRAAPEPGRASRRAGLCTELAALTKKKEQEEKRKQLAGPTLPDVT